MTGLASTPSQTVGPFLSIGMTWEGGEYVVPDGVPDSFWIHGRLLDGAGDGVPDGVIETWQADPSGAFGQALSPLGSAVENVEAWGGFGRSMTGSDGQYRVHTLKPGPVDDGQGGFQAPHLDVSVLARGLLNRVITRIYFVDEVEANAADPVLSTLPDEHARATLIAQPDGNGGYALDIRLQGAAETVFFTV
ncbi:MAG: protocatechuate 3,4-dioxygenase subunit alpha [Actinomycetota bacterium]|nr:protocatechuate 3,4-dioxygenase subunit alpha [Actinomycetota bacterium]